MRRICLILALICLFSACQGSENGMSGEMAARRVCAACGDGELRRADDDFVTAAIGASDHVKWSAVYLGATDDGTEIGLLEATDAANVPYVKKAVWEYLESERRSAEVLAMLYPGDGPRAKIAMIDGAIVAERGTLVYYILANDTRREKIRQALANG